jgi:hypothetical protein
VTASSVLPELARCSFAAINISVMDGSVEKCGRHQL